MKNAYTMLLLCIASMAYCQTDKDRQEIRSKSNVSELSSLSKKYRADSEQNKRTALALAKEKGWEVFITNKNGTVSELMGVSEDGKYPLYYSTENVDAARSTRTNFLNTGGGLGLNLNGQFMTANVWDGGATLPTHNEFGGRVSIIDGVTAINPASNNSQHANHVTGTIMAAGVVTAAKGMAYQANARTSDWTNDLAEATTEAANGMLISNHSYGWGLRNAIGAVVISPWRFGNYETVARDWDNLMYNAPYYLMVKAAGNDGLDNTANTSPLGGFTNFDKLTGWATAKNNLVVANANDAVISATGNLTSVSINSSSSQGPTDDLRIKPDITGNGTALYSTATLTAAITPLTNTSYGYATGTSMASPNVTGSLLLLQQHYKNKTGGFMRAATLKGLALHTADDAGATGPDAVFGWGLLNAKFAAETITKNGTNSIVQEHTLNNGESYSFTVMSDGATPLIASISWTDPAGVAYAGATPNIGTTTLVNDLDIRVSNGPTYFPYRLTSATTNGLGDNTKDPFERININGASGMYTVTITHKGTLSPNQKYTVIVTGITSQTTDLYIKDRPFDTGVEPNPDLGPMWISDDIWIRQNIDGGLTHENPEYKVFSPNGVYMRVYNRSGIPSTSAKVKLYFAKASSGLTWPTNFVNFNIGGVMHGDFIGEVSIPTIPAGGSTIVVVPWYPPNPADYTYDVHHFCLAARIEAGNDPMYNELNGVGIDVNTKNNNNIAWKNVSVYNLISTDFVQPTAVFVRGMRSKYINLRFLDKGFQEEFKNYFFEMGGKIEVTLDPKLFDRAKQYGSLKELEIIGENKVLITSRDAAILNLPIKQGETFGITFDFRLEKEISPEDQVILDFIQEDAIKGRLEGGERFVIVKTDKQKGFNKRTPLSVAIDSRVMTISPNPNNGIFKININQKAQGTLRIVNINGAVIYEEKSASKKEFDINISNRSAGYYMIQFISNNGTITTRKLIKN
jgi:Subtilase family/Secretion system C-terminal sorting domain